MLTTLVLLVVVGGILRLAPGWGIALTIPAGAECPTGPRWGPCDAGKAVRHIHRNRDLSINPVLQLDIIEF